MLGDSGIRAYDKEPTMKRYKVNVEMKALDLAKVGSGIQLVIFDGSERLGAVEIGHGSFYWRAARKRSPTPCASLRKNAVASTRTRPPSTASALKPQMTDRANESSTERRSAADPPTARYR